VVLAGQSRILWRSQSSCSCSPSWKTQPRRRQPVHTGGPGDLADVEHREQGRQRRDPPGERVGHTGVGVAATFSASASAAASVSSSGSRSLSSGHPGREECHCLRDVQWLWPVAQQPAGRSLDHLPPIGGRARPGTVVGAFPSRSWILRPERGAARRSPVRGVRRAISGAAPTGLLGQPEEETGAGVVDDAVRQQVATIWRRSGWSAICRRKPVAQGVREVRSSSWRGTGPPATVEREQLLDQLDLGVGEEHRQLAW